MICKREPVSPPIPEYPENAPRLADAVLDPRQLVRNSLKMAVTRLLPVLIGLWAIPQLLHGLGDERYGLLSLLWAVVGYSSLFDFGLGRALTQELSVRIGQDRHDEVAPLIASTFWVVLGLSILFSGALFFTVPMMLPLLHVPPAHPLYAEALLAFRFLISAIPALMLSMLMTGVFEAFNRFTFLAWMRIPIVIANFVVPIWLLQGTPDLMIMVVPVALTRTGALLIMMGYLPSILNAICHPERSRRIPPAQNDLFTFISTWSHLKWREAVGLFGFGKWVTISNLIRPLMLYMDRLFLSSLLGPKAIVLYTTPYDTLSRLHQLGYSIVSVLFPAFSTAYGQDPQRAVRLYKKSLGIFVALTTVIYGVIFGLSDWLMTVWLGETFALEASAVVKWIVIGLYMLSLNTLPSSMMQAIGRADTEAKLLMIELPLYIALLVTLIHYYGLVGAPMTLSIRLFIDTLILHWQVLQSVKSSPEVL